MSRRTGVFLRKAQIKEETQTHSERAEQRGRYFSIAVKRQEHKRCQLFQLIEEPGKAMSGIPQESEGC